MKERYKLIACMTVADELDGMVPDNVETQFLEFGLHAFPDKLNEQLREAIENSTGVDAILLGYGLCSKSTLGLGSPETRLVIPRVHDCIGIFMGSHKKYREQMRNEPGTYYLTKGWIEHGGDPWKVYQQWMEQFDEKMAKLLLSKTIGNYTRLAFIQTTDDDQREYTDYTRMAAEKLGLRYDKVPGNRDILRKMLTGDWDEDFVVIEPGNKASLSDFFSGD